jgi:hypothetical protein
MMKKAIICQESIGDETADLKSSYFYRILDIVQLQYDSGATLFQLNN